MTKKKIANFEEAEIIKKWLATGFLTGTFANSLSSQNVIFPGRAGLDHSGLKFSKAGPFRARGVTTQCCYSGPPTLLYKGVIFLKTKNSESFG